MPMATTSTESKSLHTPEAAYETDISVLPRIFEKHINIAILERALTADVAMSAYAQCHMTRSWQFAWLGAPDASFREDLRHRLPEPSAGEALVEDIAILA